MSSTYNQTKATTILHCKRCLMTSSRPRISFDKEGVCNACRHAEQKPAVNWDERRQEFLEIVNKYKSKDGSWDCVVPWSGGKDSSSIAWKLKFEFGLNPLLVTFSPLIPNEVGMKNREAMIQAGFDNIFYRPDQRVSRYLARRFFMERGNMKVAWDAGVNAIPVKVAAKFNIPLVFYAEHGESEYGGRLLHADSGKVRDFTEVLENQIGDDPRNWLDDQVKESDLNSYTYPDLEEVKKVGVKAYYFAYFFRWSMLENYLYIKDKISFETAPGGRTEGTFTNFDSLDDKTDNTYYYLQFIKFGFGRATRDACRMIQNNQMTREEGLSHALAYDAEYPARYQVDVLEYLNLTKLEFDNIVDQHRNPEVWEKANNLWQLRHKPQ